MRVEIVAVGTELLLGQIADTNSMWMGEHLAAAGIDSYFHQAVGDNQARIVTALRTALTRGDAVIVCGGLGPTHDDISREAIAQVMHVPMVRDHDVARKIEALFRSRGRSMPANNLRQADVPQGATVIAQTRGTAPGLICPLGRKVIYAVPGVPHEMADMVTRAVIPDLRRRMEAAGEAAGVIASRVLRTWGTSESALAEALQGRIAAWDAPVVTESASLTLAFLASGIEGIKVRLTARAPTAPDAGALLDAEEAEVRAVLGEQLGDVVFGVDDVTMEQAVAALLIERGLTLGVAESLTGGLISSRLVDVPGASAWFRGGIVAYDAAVKHAVLGVPRGPVVSASAARAMAEGARRRLGADVGIGITGVAGPERQEDVAPGTVHVGLDLAGTDPFARELHLPGDRTRVRQYAAISALDLLRRVLRTAQSGPGAPTIG